MNQTKLLSCVACLLFAHLIVNLYSVFVKDAQAGTTVTTTPTPAPVVNNPLAQQSANLVGQTMQPIQAPIAGIQPTPAEFIPVDAGQTTPIAPFAEAATVGTVEQAEMPTATDAATMTPTTVSSQVQQETDKLEAAKGTVSEDAIVDPAQQETSSVSGLEGAQGEAIKVNAPDAREIQDGEIIDGVADATKAAAFTEQIQHAEATPTKQATVQGPPQKPIKHLFLFNFFLTSFTA